MKIFRNAVFIAAIAGLCGGLALSAMQMVSTTDLILQAEVFEEQASEAAPADHTHSHDAGAAIEATSDADEPAGSAATVATAEAAHHHDADAWEPSEGFERNAFTVAANIVTGIGFALLLVAISEFAGGIGNWRHGLVWGFAGFATFTLAPGLGLAPELPGMPAADLVARQAWWISTVVATGAGLALIAFGRSAILGVLGIALLVAPHVIGAPQPESHASDVPADLHHAFVVGVTLSNLVFWSVLGIATSFARQRFEGVSGQASELAVA